MTIPVDSISDKYNKLLGNTFSYESFVNLTKPTK